MTEETNEPKAEVAEPVAPAAESVAPSAESPAPETPTEPTPSTPAPASKAAEEVKKNLKITVSSSPKKPAKQHPAGSFNPNDVAAKKAWIAQKHKEQQESLIKNGYTPTAAIAIMRYLTLNHGYEKQKAKDHLILMFEHLARSMKYSLDVFDRNTSSHLAVMLIDVGGHLTENRNLLDLPDVESQKFVMDTFDRVWKTGGGTATKEIAALKQHFVRAMYVKSPEGYAARAMYFIECIIDTTMKMVDPFEGLFHTEQLEIPDEVRKIMHLPPKGSHPAHKHFNHQKKMCPKCGKPMRYVFSIDKYFCNNPLCVDYKPRPPKKADDPRHPKSKGGYDSGKPIRQMSGVDKFKQRYSKPQPPRTIASTGPTEQVTDKDGIKHTVRKDFQKDANPFAALDQLKITPEPTAAAPAPEVKLPEPPPPQPVV